MHMQKPVVTSNYKMHSQRSMPLLRHLTINYYNHQLHWSGKHTTTRRTALEAHNYQNILLMDHICQKVSLALSKGYIAHVYTNLTIVCNHTHLLHQKMDV